METFGSLLFGVGAALLDVAEQWSLAVFATVILFDLALGRRNRWFLGFAAFQICGLAVGYVWTLRMFQQQDVSGPYAAALVTGAWILVALAVHLAWLANIVLRGRWRS